MFRLRASHLTTLLALLLAAAGCVTADSATRATGPRTTLVVENRNSGDMNLYLVRSGQRTRLGRVGGNQRQTFTLPAYVTESTTRLVLLADPVGSMMSPIEVPFTVVPGDRIQVVIPAY